MSMRKWNFQFCHATSCPFSVYDAPFGCTIVTAFTAARVGPISSGECPSGSPLRALATSTMRNTFSLVRSTTTTNPSKFSP